MTTTFFILIIIIGSVAAITAKKLTPAAGITGGVAGTFIYFGVGWTGLLLMAAFFVLATLATMHGKAKKAAMGAVQNETGRRDVGQVLANGGLCGLFGLLAIIFPEASSLFLLLLAAAFSSATADTLSSELGSIYGKKFYNILDLKKTQKGPDGVISLEGLLFGIAGSAVIAFIYCLSEGWSHYLYWLIVAGTAGNLTDSILGATLERGGHLQNNAVNFLNTLAAALVMLIVIKAGTMPGY